MAAEAEQSGQWEHSSFKVIVDTWGYVTNMEDQVVFIERLDFLPFRVSAQQVIILMLLEGYR